MGENMQEQEELKETLKAMEGFENQTMEERLDANKKIQEGLKKRFEEGETPQVTGLSPEALEKMEKLGDLEDL